MAFDAWPRKNLLAARFGLIVGLAITWTPGAAQIEAEAETGSASQDYRIGLEDVLKVSVWGEDELDLELRVRPDGKITFPLVGDLRVDGSSPEAVRNELAERLAKFIRDPNVTVIVEEINSFRVYVLGEVNEQGVYNFMRPTRLLQAIAAAGGLSEFSKKDVVLLREQNGIEQRIRIDYKKLVSGEASQGNIYLKPGDVLLVE